VAWKTCGKTVTAGTPPLKPCNANSRHSRNLTPEKATRQATGCNAHGVGCRRVDELARQRGSHPDNEMPGTTAPIHFQKQV
jgi:hypothetical protein